MVAKTKYGIFKDNTVHELIVQKCFLSKYVPKHIRGCVHAIKDTMLQVNSLKYMQYVFM